jgi:hypothetical protein
VGKNEGPGIRQENSRPDSPPGLFRATGDSPGRSDVRFSIRLRPSGFAAGELRSGAEALPPAASTGTNPDMKFRLLPLLVLAAPWPVLAAAANPPPPSEVHQFDFWLGEWSVTEGGKPAGSSRIQSIAGEHALLENWEGVEGSSGKSLNIYNATRHQWQQFWVDNSGGILELAGGIMGRSMVLANATTTRDGKAIRNRITWTPNDDGSVRQLWETSRDDGKTWQTSFDGLYRRRAP